MESVQRKIEHAAIQRLHRSTDRKRWKMAQQTDSRKEENDNEEDGNRGRINEVSIEDMQTSDRSEM